MKPCKSLFVSALIGLQMLAASNLCLALTSDRQQPIYIQSDKAERNEKSGITIYQGSVQMDQGTLRILADKVTIHSIDNKVNKIVAVGNPAHYQQQPSLDKNLVIAEGGVINYMIDKEQLLLLKNASLEQEGTTLTGDRIDYDINKSLVKANSKQQKRIQMVIPPQAPAEEPSAGKEPSARINKEPSAINEPSANKKPSASPQPQRAE